jgi:hypothetical protein
MLNFIFEYLQELFEKTYPETENKPCFDKASFSHQVLRHFTYCPSYRVCEKVNHIYGDYSQNKYTRLILGVTAMTLLKHLYVSNKNFNSIFITTNPQQCIDARGEVYNHLRDFSTQWNGFTVIEVRTIYFMTDTTILAHELAHYSMLVLYENPSPPNKHIFEQTVIEPCLRRIDEYKTRDNKEVRNNALECVEEAMSLLRLYPDNLKAQEFVAIAVQALATCGPDAPHILSEFDEWFNSTFVPDAVKYIEASPYRNNITEPMYNLDDYGIPTPTVTPVEITENKVTCSWGWPLDVILC